MDRVYRSAWMHGWSAAALSIRQMVKWTRDDHVYLARGSKLFSIDMRRPRLRQLVDIVVGNRKDRLDVGYRRWCTEVPFVAFDVSPDGKLVAYGTCEYGGHELGSDIGDAYEIGILDVNSLQRERISDNLSYDDYPVWSPSGERIVFLRRHDAGWFRLHGLLVGRASVAQPTTETSFRHGELRWISDQGLVDRVIPGTVVWSPDGRELALVLTKGVRRPDPGGTGPAIYILDIENLKLRPVTATVSPPSWSPDGKRIAFARFDGREVAVFTSAADGSDVRRVATIPGSRPVEGTSQDWRFEWISIMAWSPDGSRILYSCGDEICVVTVDGLALARFGGVLTDAGASVWSPDGSRIAVAGVFSSEKYDRNRVVLYTVAPDGSDVRILVRSDEAGALQLDVGRRAGPVDTGGCRTGVAVQSPSTSIGLVQDCKVLLKLRDKLAGEAKLDWSDDRPMTEWEGIVLGGSPVRVLEVNLAGRGLSGMIPRRLSDLTKLRKLDLRVNGLGGFIPFELSKLSNLTELLLGYNKLEGNIGVWMNRLSNLEVLNLARNRLSGAIPVELARLSELKELHLRGNQLTGEIPAELTVLHNLSHLTLDGNHLTGCVPVGLRLYRVQREMLALPKCESAGPVH